VFVGRRKSQRQAGNRKGKQKKRIHEAHDEPQRKSKEDGSTDYTDYTERRVAADGAKKEEEKKGRNL